ncbi:DNA polymerase family A protein [Pinibacter aurantiacus]|uniref:Uncharacterized protein n=1 Tax=Pinibacter aurantiacus TaxID=2851599 RepID=A0A9E2SFR7_9BACT|nr:hypothetical protein [Pinibacter aurantiacus]MBV4360644.1 hypothetical protein [Pinibacter aurantiacus]
MATISSVHDMQMLMPRLLEKYGNDTDLAYIALANPLAALEKLGYTITDEAKTELETYARFGKQEMERYNELKAKIFSLAGSTFNLQDDNETAAVFEKLVEKNQKPAAKKESASLKISDLILSAPQFVKDKWTDKLEDAKDIHPAIPALLEFRKIENSVPRFADAATLEIIQQKKQSTPLTKIAFRLSRK